MPRPNFAGIPTTTRRGPMPSSLPYRNGGNSAALPQARPTPSAPMEKPLVKFPAKLRSSTDDEESESDGEDSVSDGENHESDDEAPAREALVKHPIRNGSAGPPQVLGSSVTSLDRSLFQTRFLSMIPSPTAEVSCTLRVGSLMAKFEYVALSYHWGDQTSTRQILLDGRITKVTASLEVALQALRNSGIRVAWVDALCINQPDNSEKVYQLGQMDMIFSKAAKVIAWLGPAADDSGIAMQVLKTRQFSNQHNTAIKRLLDRPYWNRAWIIQELAKASKAEVWCGAQKLPWDIFFRGVRLWWAYMKMHVGDFEHPIMALQYFRNAEAEVKKGTARMLLSAAMVRSLHTKATLPRDKIYAVLGLARDSRDTVPTPNYLESDAAVFNTVLKLMIIEQGQLNLIFLAGIKRACSIPPSWLPRWNDALQATPWLVRCFERTDTTNNIVECKDNLTLKVTGQILGRLQANTNQVEKAPLEAKATDLLRATAWQLLKCRWNDHRLKTVPSAFDLAAVWSPHSQAAHVKLFPNLRQWYEWHADTSFAGLTLRASIATLSRNPQTLRAAQFILACSRHKASHWLDHLELAASAMSQHKMVLRTMNHLGVSQMVMVPHWAQENHLVARLRGCSLPVVLCGAGGSKYGVVGEVVEIDGWATSNARKADSDDEDDATDSEDSEDGQTSSDEDEDEDSAAEGKSKKQKCSGNLTWGSGYALGSGRALGGDWRHVHKARWARMHLV
ncbi:hypothetical protein MBLNU13_g03809t1 [Cladosporium sp. NU13]